MPSDPRESAARRLEELFHRAWGLDPVERDSFLEQACQGDPTLEKTVRRLLAACTEVDQTPEWNNSALQFEAKAAAASEKGESELGRYRLQESIGSGGMGTVYRAIRADDEFSKQVAVKIVHWVGTDESLARRFRRERQIQARLEHVNIARLLDGGSTPDGRPFLVMEFVEGVPIDRYVLERKLSVRDVLVLFRKICSAVAYAHRNLIVHRDLKPANILVTAEGEPMLLDFGIAKLLDEVDARTQTGAGMMTLAYASPEQVLGTPAATSSDIYSLGVLLYELLSGVSPYRHAADSPGLLRAIVADDPEPLRGRAGVRVDGDLEHIVRMALRKEPERRYSSVERFSEDIRRQMEGLPVAARGDAFGYVLGSFARRHRIAAVAAVAALAMLIGGLIVTLRAQARAERRFNEVRRLAHSVMFDYYDLIESLPGSTPVLQRLVKDALQYLDGLSLESDDPGLRRELVDAYVRVGNVQGSDRHMNLGDSAGATRSASKAVELAERLLVRDQGNEARASSAAAFEARGLLLHGAGDLHGAEGNFRRAVALREQVAQANPDDVQTQVELSLSWRELADLYGGAGLQNLGRTNQALDLYQRSGDLMRKLSIRFPTDLRLLKEYRNALQVLGSVKFSLGKIEEADRDLSESMRLSEAVVAQDPKNTSSQIALANANVRGGSRLIDRGEAARAVPILERTITALDKLLAADPGNALFQRALSLTESLTGAALRASGEAQRALPHNWRSLQFAETLGKLDPGMVEHRADIAISHRKLAESLLAAGDSQAALDHARRAGGVLGELAKGSSDAYLQSQFAKALIVEGDAKMKTGDWNGAGDSYRGAGEIAVVVSTADPANALVRADLARAELGRGAALIRLGHQAAASEQFVKAAEHWNQLRARKALTSDDAARAAETAKALIGVEPRR